MRACSSIFEGKRLGDLRLPETGQRVLELAVVELAVSIEVEALEDAAQRADADPALLLDVHFEIQVHLVHRHLHAYAVERHRSPKSRIFLPIKRS